MEFIRTIRQKRQVTKQRNILREADEVIALQDFAGSIYIAYNGMPIIELDNNLKGNEILAKLDEVRRNYIHARSELSKTKVIVR